MLEEGVEETCHSIFCPYQMGWMLCCISVGLWRTGKDPCQGVGVVQISVFSLVKDYGSGNAGQPLTPVLARKVQDEAEILFRVLWYKTQNKSIIEVKAEHPAVATLLNEDGVLHCKTSRREHLVIPKAYHPLIFKELHQDLGHLGVEGTLDLIWERFYWPQMHQDVENVVTKVCNFVKKKPNMQIRPPLTPIQTTCPFELVMATSTSWWS